MINFNKILAEFLDDQGYHIIYTSPSTAKAAVCVTIGSTIYDISFNKHSKCVTMHAFVDDASGITIDGHAQLKLVKTPVGNIYDPMLFDKLLDILEKKKQEIKDNSYGFTKIV